MDFSNLNKKEFIEKYRFGTTIKDLAIKYKVNVRTINRWAEQLITTGKMSKACVKAREEALCKKDKRSIIVEYAKSHLKMGYREIAKKLKFSESYVYIAMINAGLNSGGKNKNLRHNIVEYIKKDPTVTALQLAQQFKVSDRHASRILKESGLGIKKVRTGTTIKPPKILLLDLETSPMEVEVWQLRNNMYIPHTDIKKESAMLTWAAKWLEDSELLGGFVTPRQAHQRVDKDISQDLWDLFDAADIILGHNIDGFDVKVANTRFIMNGFKPYSSIQTIDTLKTARSKFRFASNKLDYLCSRLAHNKKIDTSKSLWRRCIDNKDNSDAEAAIQEMYRYNQQDVLLLEDLYLEMRPWMKSHPNMALRYNDPEGRCGYCGLKTLEMTSKAYFTYTGQYRVQRCKNPACQGFTRLRFNELTKEQRRDLNVTVAR